MSIIYTQLLVSKGRPLCPECPPCITPPRLECAPRIDSEGLSVLGAIVKVPLPGHATVTLGRIRARRTLWICTEPPATKVCTGQDDFSRWDSTSGAHCTGAQGLLLTPSMWPGGVKVLLFTHKPLNVWGCSYSRTRVARICLLVMGLYKTVRLLTLDL